MCRRGPKHSPWAAWSCRRSAPRLGRPCRQQRCKREPYDLRPLPQQLESAPKRRGPSSRIRRAPSGPVLERVEAHGSAVHGGFSRSVGASETPTTDLCGNQISGAPSHRRDVVAVTASARVWAIDSPLWNDSLLFCPAEGSPSRCDEKLRDAVYGMPVSRISPVLWASRVLELHLRQRQPVLGDGQGVGVYSKSKLLRLVRYCYLK